MVRRPLASAAMHGAQEAGSSLSLRATAMLHFAWRLCTCWVKAGGITKAAIVRWGGQHVRMHAGEEAAHPVSEVPQPVISLSVAPGRGRRPWPCMGQDAAILGQHHAANAA